MIWFLQQKKERITKIKVRNEEWRKCNEKMKKKRWSNDRMKMKNFGLKNPNNFFGQLFMSVNQPVTEWVSQSVSQSFMLFFQKTILSFCYFFFFAFFFSINIIIIIIFDKKIFSKRSIMTQSGLKSGMALGLSRWMMETQEFKEKI